MNRTTPRKVFISYSWGSDEHNNWVIHLAADLMKNGIDVILDKWDLGVGHDINAFMERMVIDPTVEKVIIICDKAYADKSDKRRGGVGTEAQIITSVIYKKQNQDKYIPILKERDGNDNDCLPSFLKNRKYIDFTDIDKYSEKFKELISCIFDKPIYEKPQIGKLPSYIMENDLFGNDKATLEIIKHERLESRIKMIIKSFNEQINAIRDRLSNITKTLSDKAEITKDDMNILEEYYNGTQVLLELGEKLKCIDYFNRAYYLSEKNKYYESIIEYDKALEINPQYIGALYNKGNAYNCLQQYENALEAYSKVLVIKPDYYFALNNIGFSLFHLRKFEDALNYLKKATEIRPDYPSAWYNIACVNAIIKNKSEMLSNLKKSIDLDNKYKGKGRIDIAFKVYWEDRDFISLTS